MKYKTILLTGGSGYLGQAIIKSGLFSDILAPSHEEMNITKEEAVAKFFKENKPDAVIHCAAMVKMIESEHEPVKAIDTNIIGTCGLIKEVLKAEKERQKKLRFIYISTDGVYPGTNGNYSERDVTIPYNKYGWSKLAGECAVNFLSNFCIIRTSFFVPSSIEYEFYAADKYSSRVPIDYLPKAIAFMLEKNFIGTLNIGGKKESDYERYKKIKSNIKPCAYEDIAKKSSFGISRDASMNSFVWDKLKEDVRKLNLDE